jgi:GT2 family glycosyltransferase
MNPVLVLTHNTLALTKKCIASIEAQDIPTSIFVIDNDSSDGTKEWLSSDEYKGVWKRFTPQLGVSKGWNFGLNKLFYDSVWNAEFVLCPNSDTILPSWFYRELLTCDGALVSGVSVDRMEQIAERPARMERNPHPDFSAFLLRREAWEKIGPFDERMVNYCSDCAYHIEAVRKGVQLYKTGLPFYHERSSTLKLAPPKEHLEMSRQADADRQVFRSIYGCIPGEPAYEEFFKCEMQ